MLANIKAYNDNCLLQVAVLVTLANSVLMKMQQVLVGCVKRAISAVVILNQPHQVQVKTQDLVQRATTVLLTQVNRKNVLGALSRTCNS